MQTPVRMRSAVSGSAGPADPPATTDRMFDAERFDGARASGRRGDACGGETGATNDGTTGVIST